MGRQGAGDLPPPAELVAVVGAVGEVELAVLEWPVALTTPACLTDAEAQVCALLAEGLSNAQIARRRETSARTVANQVASVFRKLRVGSRSDLIAALAARPGRP